MSKVDSYIILDTETGGLNSNLSPILELGFISIDPVSLNQSARYEEYVMCENCSIITEQEYNAISAISAIPNNPYFEGFISSKALEMNGITIDTIIKKGKSVKTVVSECIEMFQSVKCGSRYTKPVLVGHNILFDVDFLDKMFSVCKKDLSKYIEGKISPSGNWYPMVIDTIFLAKMRDPMANSYNLRAVSDSMNIELSNAHRAIYDVLATSEIFKKTVAKIRSEETNGAEVKKQKLRYQI